MNKLELFFFAGLSLGSCLTRKYNNTQLPDREHCGPFFFLSCTPDEPAEMCIKSWITSNSHSAEATALQPAIT